MKFRISELTLETYEAVLELWEDTSGIGLSSADSRAAIDYYLARNPGLSFVAYEGPLLVGAVLCGHDGRRGFIHHLAVRDRFRSRGLGRELVERCLAGLREVGIQKCHLFVFDANKDAIEFWKHIGFTERVELVMMSKMVE